MVKTKLFLKNFLACLGLICGWAVLLTLACKAACFFLDFVYEFSEGNFLVGLLLMGLPIAIVISAISAWESTHVDGKDREK